MDEAALEKLWSFTIGGPVDFSTLSSEASYKPPLTSLPPPPPPVARPSFETGNKIGSGGMAEIYSARQAGLEREVALKKIKRRRAQTAHVRSNFLAEAVITGRLEHPNIVPVYALGKDENGLDFLAMKLVGGRSWAVELREARKDGSFALDPQLEILIQLCNAVAFAHENGIIHNDLKPSNVMLGRFGEVLLLDWGLAVAFDPKLQHDPFLRFHTHIQGPCGTPIYMAPEQALGKGAQLGPHTDIYLLGAILYELLTGKPPNVAPRLVETLHQALHGPPLAFPPDVPAELEAICRHALQPSPDLRHASVLQLQDELKAFRLHRESLEIARLAARRLQACQFSATSGEFSSTSDNSSLYRNFAEVVASFQAARRLWADNVAAVEGERDARFAYAEAALALGDLGLARTQAANLPDARGERLREEISAARQRLRDARQARRRLRTGTLLGALVVILGLVAGLVLLELKNLEISREREALARRTEERELLRFQADVGVQSFLINSQMQQLEHTARVLAEVGTSFITAGDPDPRPLYSNVDFDEGGAELAAWSTLYGKDISIETPVYKLAPGVALGDVEDELRCLMRLRSQFKWMFLGSRLPALPVSSGLEVIRLLTVEGVPLRWAYIGLASGVMFSYPGKGGYPADYDPRLRPWYALGAHSREVRWGEPYPDLHNLGLVLPCVTSLIDDAGRFYGVAGVEMTFDFLINTYMRPARDVEETYLVDRDGAIVVRSRQQVAIPGGVGVGAVELERFPFAAVLEAVAAGATAGVVEAEEDGQQLLLGFHQVPSLGWTYIEKRKRRAVLGLIEP